jgi:formate dehydrogenase subunit gamma
VKSVAGEREKQMTTDHGADAARAQATARSVAQSHHLDRGPLLPILREIQAELGYIDPAVIPVVAEELNISRADVHGVVTFYRDFRDRPAGRTTVRICRAEACQARGSDALVAHATQRLDLPLGETSADGELTLDQVFCLGNCALGPNVEVAGRMYGRVDADRFDALVAEATGGDKVAPA